MKNLIVFFLSLICLAAQAQYNQNRALPAKPTLLSYYGAQKLDKNSTSPVIRINTQHAQSGTTQTQGYTLYSNNNVGPVSANQQGYWSGSRMTTNGLNGKFQAVQSFDMSGNLRESKATYQFTNRKKR